MRACVKSSRKLARSFPDPSGRSASLIEKDQEEIPDVDLAANVGRDLILDEKIPSHESGQGFVRSWNTRCFKKRQPPRFSLTKG